MTGDDETNFPHKLLLTNRQVTNLRKTFANYLSVDIKLSKTQLSKMMQSGGKFLGRLLGPSLKTGLTNVITNVIKPLAKNLLIPLELTAAASVWDAGIHKKILRSGHITTLIIANDEIQDIVKIIKSLEDSGLLLKGVTETVQNEVKEQKGGFISMLLENALTGRGINRTGEGVLRADYENKKGRKNNKMNFLCHLIL